MPSDILLVSSDVLSLSISISLYLSQSQVGWLEVASLLGSVTVATSLPFSSPTWRKVYNDH